MSEIYNHPDRMIASSPFPGEKTQTFAAAIPSPNSQVIPIVEEQVEVGTRTVVTGTVRLEKRVEEYQETLNIPLASRSFDIERVVLNRPVEKAPEIRHEGDTTIYSLVEEQLVITRQLILKEEVRVTRRDAERIDDTVVTLRREHLDVTRTPAVATPDRLS